MNSRRSQDGLVIAAICKLHPQENHKWLVPSQSTSKKYTVDVTSQKCTCEDSVLGNKCKHIFAVEYTIQRERNRVTEVPDVVFERKKQTYSQNWKAYNLAQTTEKARFQILLHDLCRGIQPFEYHGRGRKPIPACDALFTSCLKVYSTFSGRRASCDILDALEKGFISRPVHYNSVCMFMENPELTSRLNSAIIESSRPLKAVEREFAVDSSGFSCSRFDKWVDEKYGTSRSGHDWVKVHIAAGLYTNIVTAAIIEHRTAADSPFLKPLLQQTAKNFVVKELSADKAYLSAENIEAIVRQGATPFIPFKRNSTGEKGGWFEAAYCYYSLHHDDFLKYYHKRSNVETIFHMIKTKFRDHVRSRTDTAMRNEVLCKILCHNICVLIQSQCEMKIETEFWKDGDEQPLSSSEKAEPLPRPYVDERHSKVADITDEEWEAILAELPSSAPIK